MVYSINGFRLATPQKGRRINEHIIFNKCHINYGNRNMRGDIGWNRKEF